MKVLICGGRDENASDVLKWLEDNFFKSFPEATGIIHGGAKGADRGAALFCEQHKFPVTEYKANWKQYGKRAGYLRNKYMLDHGKPYAVLAFPGGVGTKMMIDLANQADVPVYEIKNY